MLLIWLNLTRKYPHFISKLHKLIQKSKEKKASTIPPDYLLWWPWNQQSLVLLSAAPEQQRLRADSPSLQAKCFLWYPHRHFKHWINFWRSAGLFNCWQGQAVPVSSPLICTVSQLQATAAAPHAVQPASLVHTRLDSLRSITNFFFCFCFPICDLYISGANVYQAIFFFKI